MLHRCLHSFKRLAAQGMAESAFMRACNLACKPSARVLDIEGIRHKIFERQGYRGVYAG
jgi:hypothetical protein